MKTARRRSLVLYAILIGFVIGMVCFIVSFVFQGGAWAMRRSNAHLNGTSQLGNAGNIYDRDGTLIAYSADGERHYSEDYTTRCALLHVLGDTDGYISTGVQSTALTTLTGYDPILGLNGYQEQTGGDMHLTVSASLSALALQQLGDRKGAVALYNYQTGEVLCMVSTPTYDPSAVPDDLMDNSDYEGVFLNKALSSTFTPGSTFKVLTTACALENGIDPDTWTYDCTGTTIINGNEIVCDSHTAHGQETLQDALTNSCNCAFAELAVELGRDKLNATANEMGCNQSFLVDDNQTAASTFSLPWNASADEIAWSGIGQGNDLMNPTHMMILMGAIANGGTPVLPYTIASSEDHVGSAQLGSQLMPASVAGTLGEMLRHNVEYGYGDYRFPGLNVCAKTGTAEVEDGKADTGWIVGYSQNPDTPYAFAVVVEEGGYGLSSAGQIASTLLQAAAG